MHELFSKPLSMFMKEDEVDFTSELTELHVGYLNKAFGDGKFSVTSVIPDRGLAMITTKNEDGFRIRGMVADLACGISLCPSYGYPREMVGDKIWVEDNMYCFGMGNDVAKVPIETAKFYRNYEGVVFRIFYFDGIFYTTTYRYLEPGKRKWMCTKPYLEAYKLAGGPNLEDIFDTSKKYGRHCITIMVVEEEFLVSSKEKYTQPYIAHLLTTEINYEIAEADSGITKDMIDEGGAERFLKYGESLGEKFLPIKELTLDEANDFLACGHYPERKGLPCPFNFGETVSIVVDVDNSYKLSSSSAAWRTYMHLDVNQKVSPFYYTQTWQKLDDGFNLFCHEQSKTLKRSYLVNMDLPQDIYNKPITDNSLSFRNKPLFNKDGRCNVNRYILQGLAFANFFLATPLPLQHRLYLAYKKSQENRKMLANPKTGLLKKGARLSPRAKTLLQQSNYDPYYLNQFLVAENFISVYNMTKFFNHHEEKEQ